MSFVWCLIQFKQNAPRFLAFFGNRCCDSSQTTRGSCCRTVLCPVGERVSGVHRRGPFRLSPTEHTDVPGESPQHVRTRSCWQPALDAGAMSALLGAHTGTRRTLGAAGAVPDGAAEHAVTQPRRRAHHGEELPGRKGHLMQCPQQECLSLTPPSTRRHCSSSCEVNIPAAGGGEPAPGHAVKRPGAHGRPAGQGQTPLQRAE